jgi:ubiquinone/menaquinone biosynthesis C-methylase UbiE
MLERAVNKMKAKGIQAELLLANASYLPYLTSSFDAVFHNGGLNTFADKKRAIEEMHRVAKPKGKIVICDEGILPEKQNTWLGKRLIKRESLYTSLPPAELVPPKSENLKSYYSDTGLSWIIEFNKQ